MGRAMGGSRGIGAGTAAPRLPGGGTTAVPAKDTGRVRAVRVRDVHAVREPLRRCADAVRGAGRGPVPRGSLPTTTTVPEPC